LMVTHKDDWPSRMDHRQILQARHRSAMDAWVRVIVVRGPPRGPVDRAFSSAGCEETHKKSITYPKRHLNARF
jgi:hypothetical protein